MDELTYELLTWLAEGYAVFRPREATAEAETAFREVVALLRRLRDAGLVSYLEGHISQMASGIFVAVGPVLLTPAGRAALERDRRLGERPPWKGSLPWRR
jgi:hypothetical protein